jgi:hypothetical protein
MYKEKIQATHLRQSVKTSSDGYTRLAIAILAQAYRDTKSVDVFKRQEALDWLHSADCENYCDFLDINPEWLINAIRNPTTGASVLPGDLLPVGISGLFRFWR